MSTTRAGVSFVKEVVASRLWGPSPMAVVDIGARGGISDRWSLFGEHLAAVGFDTLATEAERLNAHEDRIDVRYEVARVGCREYDSLFPPELQSDPKVSAHTPPFARSSTFAAERIGQMKLDSDRLEPGSEARPTKRFVTLDEYLATLRLRPNALRIEAAGADFEVLLGAKFFISSPDLLCIQSTVQFHGPVHDYANTFANVDRFVRERGFSLFDLRPARYSRAALPAPFAMGRPARTLSGQVHWGEAVYFRDLGNPSYKDICQAAPTRERLLKSCCLLAAYGFDDCAAELLVSAPGLADLPERTQLLNMLTPSLFDDATYSGYMARFESDPSAWLPEGLKSKAELSSGEFDHDDRTATYDRRTELRRDERLQAELLELKERVARLKKVQRKLRARVERSEFKITKLRNERLQYKKHRRNQASEPERHGWALADFVSRVRAGFHK